MLSANCCRPKDPGAPNRDAVAVAAAAAAGRHLTLGTCPVPVATAAQTYQQEFERNCATQLADASDRSWLDESQGPCPLVTCDTCCESDAKDTYSAQDCRASSKGAMPLRATFGLGTDDLALDGGAQPHSNHAETLMYFLATFASCPTRTPRDARGQVALAEHGVGSG